MLTWLNDLSDHLSWQIHSMLLKKLHLSRSHFINLYVSFGHFQTCRLDLPGWEIKSGDKGVKLSQNVIPIRNRAKIGLKIKSIKNEVAL